jgi:hypothetical protein
MPPIYTNPTMMMRSAKELLDVPVGVELPWRSTATAPEFFIYIEHGLFCLLLVAIIIAVGVWCYRCR